MSSKTVREHEQEVLLAVRDWKELSEKKNFKKLQGAVVCNALYLAAAEWLEAVKRQEGEG